MGNINYNDRFGVGIVSPSYKVFSIAEGYDKCFVAAMLKTQRALYNYTLVSEQGASIVRRNLNIEGFSQLIFRIPPLKIQQKIGNTISAMLVQLEQTIKLRESYNTCFVICLYEHLAKQILLLSIEQTK